MNPISSFLLLLEKSRRNRAVRRGCTALFREGGFILVTAPGGLTCNVCAEDLREVQMMRSHSTPAGVFECPVGMAMTCIRCAWVSDGSGRIAVWRWIGSGAGSRHKDFFLRIERASLKMRLVQIEDDLQPRKTLLPTSDKLMQDHRLLMGGED